MGEQDAWLRAEIGGTKRASVIQKPEVLIALLKKAAHPIFIIGHETVETKNRSEILIRLIKELQISGVSIVATAHITGELISRGIKPDATFGSMEIVDRLRDPSWVGLDGKGRYDLILMAGFSYSLGWLLLSGLRQEKSPVKIISLDPKYQPHASWSFGNMRDEAWQKEIERIIDQIHPEHKTEEAHV